MRFAVMEAVDLISADMKHFPRRKVVVYPACLSWLIDSKDSQKVEV